MLPHLANVLVERISGGQVGTGLDPDVRLVGRVPGGQEHVAFLDLLTLAPHQQMTRVYEVPGTKLSVFADAVGGKDEGLHAIGHLRMMCTMATRWAAAPGSRYRAGHGTQLLEEDLAMSDRMPEPGNAGDQRGSEPDMSGTAEFAKMRAVMRASEKHREGGVDPELEDADADPAPDT